LYYPDVREAVEWLTTALPFTERLRIADHRYQLLHGNGAIVVATPDGHADAAPSTLQSPEAHSVLLRVTGIDQLFERAKAAGALFSQNRRITCMAHVNARSLTRGDAPGRFRRLFSIPTHPTGAVNS
jgi:hypothetical protein